jgi:Rod binding domain-containing protein
MISPLQPLTAEPQKSDARPEPTAQQREAAQQFEAIFLRQLLKGMEKGSGINKQEQGFAGEMYRSMLVGTLADNASEGGGIGLSDLVLQSLLDRNDPKIR